MKIVEVNTYTVRPRWGFVEIVTDEGLTGWGEPVLEGHCATVLACVQEMKPYLIGKDPMRIEDFSTVSNFIKLLSILNHSRVRSIYAIYVCVDFAKVST